MQSKTESVLHAGAGRWRPWLQRRGRWRVIALLFVIVAAVAIGWPWLAPLGALPFLVSILPCLAMCGLGLCMHRMNGSACGTQVPKEE